MQSQYLKDDLLVLVQELEKQHFGGSTILITGVTGLIGSLCLKAILAFNQTHINKIKAVGLARSEEKVQSIIEGFSTEALDDISFIYQDIVEKMPVIVNCDYIIHTANPTTSKYFITNPVEVIESIYTGTKMILEYGVQKKVKGIVYLSSMEVFGQVDFDGRISESELGYIDLTSVRSCYSEGKRVAELLCKSYSDEYGLPVKIARLAQTFGAGVPTSENRVFAQFARSAIRGEDIVLHTKGESVGNYCYTRDVVKAILLLLKNGESGAAYTVVNEETTRTIAEMAQMVADKFSGGRSTVVFDIPVGNQYGYAPNTKMRLSSDKIRQLGWFPEVTLEEMYRRMIPDL